MGGVRQLHEGRRPGARRRRHHRVARLLEAGGDEPHESNAKDVIEASNLGYCEFFHFKCAGDRTCDAWIVGGPVK